MKPTVQLEDPVLDAKDPLTRMFLLAEHWKRKYLEMKQAAQEQGKDAAPNIKAAAMKLAECMDYPWEHMPEQGRQSMRVHAQRVLQAAALAHKGAQGDKA